MSRASSTFLWIKGLRRPAIPPPPERVTAWGTALWGSRSISHDGMTRMLGFTGIHVRQSRLTTTRDMTHPIKSALLTTAGRNVMQRKQSAYSIINLWLKNNERSSVIGWKWINNTNNSFIKHSIQVVYFLSFPRWSLKSGIYDLESWNNHTKYVRGKKLKHVTKHQIIPQNYRNF